VLVESLFRLIAPGVSTRESLPCGVLPKTRLPRDSKPLDDSLGAARMAYLASCPKSGSERPAGVSQTRSKSVSAARSASVSWYASR
jgi:hypothetical protein